MLTDAIRTGQLLSKNSRPQNGVFSGTLAAATAYIAGGAILRCILCYTLIVLLYAASVSLNNATDVHTDTINQRTDNPLVNNRLRRRTLTIFVIAVLCCLAVIQVFLAQPYSAVWTILYLGLAYAYSNARFRIQSRGLWATCLLCVCYSALPLTIGASQRSPGPSWACLIVTPWVILATAPTILAKDYKDYAGDKQTGKRTPLVRYGASSMRILAYVSLTISCIGYFALLISHGSLSWQRSLYALAYIPLTMSLHNTKRPVPRVYKTLLLLSLIVMCVSLLRSVS